jgi:hypothetical protein
MDIQRILRELLIQEVVAEVSEVTDGITNDRIKDIVIQVTSPIIFEIPVKHSKPCIVDDPQRCCARIWDSHRGSRCHSRIKTGDYCGKHHSEIERKGYLQFRRYDECKPTINEKGTIISWYEHTPIEALGVIDKYQLMNLKKLIKRTEITP